jgi:hypothetical protein
MVVNNTAVLYTFPRSQPRCLHSNCKGIQRDCGGDGSHSQCSLVWYARFVCTVQCPSPAADLNTVMESLQLLCANFVRCSLRVLKLPR